MSIAPHDPDSEATSENAPQNDDFQWPSPEHVARVLAGVKRVEIGPPIERTLSFSRGLGLLRAASHLTDEEIDELKYEYLREKHL